MEDPKAKLDYFNVKICGVYIQDQDSCASDEEKDKQPEQELDISIEDAGGGRYFVIKTNRWAFDSPQEVTDVLKEFEAAVKRLEKASPNVK